MTQVEKIYDLRLPTEAHRLLRYFRIGISLGLEGIPFDCMSSELYASKLNVWIYTPAAIFCVVGAVSALRLMRQHHASSRDEGLRLSANEIFVKALPAVLQVAFLCYPIVASVAFEAWSCYEFSGESGRLIADVDVECGSPQHQALQGVAWIAIACYPVGLFALNAALLFRARKTIRSGGQTALARTIDFLHCEYEPHFYWWELCEMARRFLLVGLFVVGPAKRGSVMQMAVAALVCLGYLAIQTHAQPYRRGGDDLLALLCSFLLTIFFFACLVLKYINLTQLGDLQERMSRELKEDYLVSPLMITVVLVICVIGTFCFSLIIFFVQTAVEQRRRLLEDRDRRARRLRHKISNEPIQAPPLGDGEDFHTFLSHVR